MARVGLISDTHGLLRPEALAYLRGSDHIVHAGDIGTPEILVILLIALLVFGPHRLPDVARQVGSAMRELRKIQDTVRGELDTVLHSERGTRSDDRPDGPAAI